MDRTCYHCIFMQRKWDGNYDRLYCYLKGDWRDCNEPKCEKYLPNSNPRSIYIAPLMQILAAAQGVAKPEDLRVVLERAGYDQSLTDER